MGVYGFKRQLSIGKVGEIIFEEAHCRDLLRLDGFKSDFQCKTSGDTYELKTDMWGMEKTPNFFFERWSDRDKGTPGGPWQARVNGTTFFVYFYVSNLTYFRFNTEKLITALEPIIERITPTEVVNTKHTTIGYRVPRTLVQELGEEVKISACVKEAKNK